MHRCFSALTAGLLALASSCTAWAGDEAGNPDERQARAIVDSRCFSCHGQTGLSTTSQFPKLAGQNAEYLTKQMFNFQSGLRASVVMEEQMAGLSGNEIESLARYFARQKAVPEAASGDREAVRLGARLFRTGKPAQKVPACASCHGPQAYGARMLPRLAGQYAPYLERQLHAFVARTRGNDQMTMHDVASHLTGDEMRAVAIYLSGLR
jgi:cytochrome c553